MKTIILNFNVRSSRVVGDCIPQLEALQVNETCFVIRVEYVAKPVQDQLALDHFYSVVCAPHNDIFFGCTFSKSTSLTREHAFRKKKLKLKLKLKWEYVRFERITLKL